MMKESYLAKGMRKYVAPTIVALALAGSAHEASAERSYVVRESDLHETASEEQYSSPLSAIAGIAVFFGFLAFSAHCREKDRIRASKG